MTSAVETEILEPMQRLFTPPRNMDEGMQANALREYVSALNRYEPQDLSTAWASVRDTHTARSWPLPAAFILAARAAAKERNPKPTRYDGKPSARALWLRWETISGSALADDAMARGVSWALKLAVLDGKGLDQISLAQFEAAKASAEILAGRIERGEPIFHAGREFEMAPDNAKSALDMWRTLLIRNAETDDEIRKATR